VLFGGGEENISSAVVALELLPYEMEVCILSPCKRESHVGSMGAGVVKKSVGLPAQKISGAEDSFLLLNLRS